MMTMALLLQCLPFVVNKRNYIYEPSNFGQAHFEL